MADGGPISRRTLLGTFGGLVAAGVGGRVADTGTEQDARRFGDDRDDSRRFNEGEWDADRPTVAGGETGQNRAGSLDVVLYNADDRPHEVAVAVAAADGTVLSDERTLPAGEAERVPDAVPVRDRAVEYATTVAVDGGDERRESTVVDPLQAPQEMHVVVRDSERVTLSTVAE